MLFKIVVPLYRNNLSDNEWLSLNNISKYYSKSDICLCIPKNLLLGESLNKYENVRFDDFFFESVSSYNKLMLSQVFYESFKSYKYILIHQLDAYIFKDELKLWCDKDYDYVGAPWLKSENPFNNLYKSKKLKDREPIFYNVGNGGFSLRKVKTFLKFIEKYDDIITRHENHPLYNIEDVFWSLIAPKYIEFVIPDYKEVAKFSLDRKPKIGLKINEGQLPFGCHGFEKSKTKSFWQKYIQHLS
ncbi:DUF5672 family protein [Flavobacterium sp. CS20]|uniref:DUF5672 family protein n=1 Tax=Flavobacterium sp. CS20 TaxID=2775246 RepID=UPI001B3A72DE|nr:DUF5672 family protein [Flavobacterium sp. CS20]QTY27665.1 hypothetical protein IGB25_03785 [Flavobacterium sp. CS20]